MRDLEPQFAHDGLRVGTIHVPATRRSNFLVRLFVLSFLTRLLLIAIITVTDAIVALSLSPDSLRYDREGVWIAQEMGWGDFNWPNWIDNGWFQFTGFVYYLFGPHPILMQVINAFIGSITPVLIYRLVLRVYGEHAIAAVTAILVAFFPSFVYWSCLMLKDPIAILAVVMLVLGVVALQTEFRVKWIASIVGGLLILLGVRQYLSFVAIVLVLISLTPVEGRRTGRLLLRLAIMLLTLGSLAYAGGYGFLGFDYVAQSHYFDLAYINSSRVNIGHGTGAFFGDADTPVWGENSWGNVRAAFAAIFFFFVTLDVTEIASVRQAMALPEVLIVLWMLPNLGRGIVWSWRNVRQRSFPMLVFVFGILAVYGSAATNMGAMFRWRMQALPLILAFICYAVFTRGRGRAYRLLSRIAR
jgi:hypothetical protein